MPSPLSTSALLGLSLALSAASARAQGVDSTRRALPPSAAAAASFPAFDAAVPPAEEATPHDLAAAWWLPHPVRVTILTPFSVAGLARRDSLSQRVASCFGRASGGGSAEVPQPWAAVDSALAGRAYVLLQLDAPLSHTSACEAVRDLVVRVAGVQLVDSTARVAARNDLRSVSAAYRGHSLAPAITARAGAVVVGPRERVLPAVPGILRAYLAPDDLGPDERGRFASAVLEVRSADSTRRDTLIVADTVVAQLWRELLPWRLARLRATAATNDLPRLRAPSDTVLQRAARLYANGYATGAALVATNRRERFAGVSREPSDARFVELLVGSALLAHGDSAAARVEYSAAVADAPCLRLAAHPAFDRVLDALRPAATRCTSVPLVRQLASGLVVPGGGQWVRGNRVAGAATSLVTVGLLATAIQRNLQAQRRFDAYRQAAPPSPVDDMLDQANDSRRAARSAALGAASVWLASAAIGFAREVWHERQVARERGYEPAATDTGVRR